ncbi:MAG: hypothetical protein KDA61_12015 [Planctomycetales bacterium]|nr:hypothetical protein [Planctomycetales bacterium]
MRLGQFDSEHAVESFGDGSASTRWQRESTTWTLDLRRLVGVVCLGGVCLIGTAGCGNSAPEGDVASSDASPASVASAVADEDRTAPDEAVSDSDPSTTSVSSPVGSSPGALSLDDAESEAKANEVANEMLDAYRRATSYADNATYVQYFVLRGEGVRRQMPFFQMALAFKRPNLLRLRFEEAVSGEKERKAFDVVSDGSRVRCAALTLPGQISEVDAPAAMSSENVIPDPLVRDSVLQRGIENVLPQLAMLLHEDEQSLVFPHDDAPKWLGVKELRGKLCDVIASQSPAGRRVFWIDQETSLLLRMELPIENEKAELDPDDAFMEMSVWIDFHDASSNVQLASTTFEMEVPDGTQVVNRLVRPPLPGISANQAEDAANQELIEAATSGEQEPSQRQTLLEELAEFYEQVAGQAP